MQVVTPEYPMPPPQTDRLSRYVRFDRRKALTLLVGTLLGSGAEREDQGDESRFEEGHCKVKDDQDYRLSLMVSCTLFIRRHTAITSTSL